MVKNRLAELQSRAKYPPIEEGGEASIPLNQKPTTYDDIFSSFSSISLDIDKLKSFVEDIHKIQGTLLNSARKDESLEDSMNTKMNEAKKLGKSIRMHLEKQKILVADEENDESMEARMRRTQFTAQSKRFYNIWTDYNAQQVDFREKSKKLLVRRCKIANTGYDDEEIETMLDEGKTGVFATTILDQERLARLQLVELQDRHHEFLKLEASIREVRDMFVDIAGLVSSQGEIIDTVYTHVISAETNVEAGRNHLTTAENLMKKARKKKFCLLVVGLVILFIILMIILYEIGVFSWGGDSTHTKEIVYVYVDKTTTEAAPVLKESDVSFVNESEVPFVNESEVPIENENEVALANETFFGNDTSNI